MYKSKESFQKVLNALKVGRETTKNKSKVMAIEYYKNPKCCLQCQAVLLYKNRMKKFCSPSCSATYNNLRGAIGRKRGKHVNCINCGELLKNKYSQYCNTTCMRIYRLKKINEKIESNADTTAGALRRYMLNKYNSKCQICGWGIPNPVSNTVCLDLHHIDGISKNNFLSNVQLLCPNCHSLTPNYKRVGDKNRKSDRDRK